jgi:hypothetical protein
MNDHSFSVFHFPNDWSCAFVCRSVDLDQAVEIFGQLCCVAVDSTRRVVVTHGEDIRLVWTPFAGVRKVGSAGLRT